MYISLLNKRSYLPQLTLQISSYKKLFINNNTIQVYNSIDIFIKIISLQEKFYKVLIQEYL